MKPLEDVKKKMSPVKSKLQHDYKSLFHKELEIIEKKLDEVLPLPGNRFPLIHEAMRYAVLGGGKRFRPVLALLSCHAAGGKIENALLPAIALELIHSYSLVHDDLPCMDNDDFRRGEPTCHKKFGEAIALLAGDGLLTLAFQILADAKPESKAVLYLREISTASGTYGMIGGQVADIQVTKRDLNLPTLEYIHTHKTGQLIKASAVCGAIAADANSEVQKRILRFGELLGVAFQSVDDYLDNDGFSIVMNRTELAQKIRDLIAKSKRELKPLGKKADPLHFMAQFLLERMN